MDGRDKLYSYHPLKVETKRPVTGLNMFPLLSATSIDLFACCARLTSLSQTHRQMSARIRDITLMYFTTNCGVFQYGYEVMNHTFTRVLIREREFIR